ncbi:glycan-binding surface protein [Gaoshiqia sediminis]|uniref:Glycan-binding surface protein n=1 Tax=Gaoshiqia sediminis TaxID=2986998 RepID=A0AA41YAN4_9BACT|nr:glycan-binding surface protein [Gaoshiqia sediminis]MCW0484477.1 glycan-binding surface protein [Gaoshiqia sediminis]
MKKILFNRIHFFVLSCLVLVVMQLSSCKEEVQDAAPVITAVRNYAPAPDDTLVTGINPGQWIVIHGSNLAGAVGISFNGMAADILPELFSDNTAVVQVPDAVPFFNVAPDVLNTIDYVTTAGSTVYRFDVIPLPVAITGNSLLARNVVGDSIFVYGTNLFLVENLTIADVEIAPLKTVSDGSSIGFVFPVIDAPQPWEAVVVAKSGTYTFTISVEPKILAVSNANPAEGDSVKVYGINLNGVSSVSFGGASITDYTEDPDGFYVAFKAPNQWSYASGPLSIEATYGTATTPYPVNTQNGVTEGLLANVEWGDYFSWGWWGDVSLTVNNVASSGGWMTVRSDFDGTFGTNNSMFLSFNTPVLDGGASKYCPLGGNINQWVPEANTTDPVENWALQFELSVAHPWNGGTLYFKTEFAGESYVARYEPWKISATKTVDYETDGWQTVTLPLTLFRQKDANGELGLGEPLASLKMLLGSSGNTKYDLTLKNFSGTPTKTGFYGAIDNIRVVKIK